MYCHPERSEGSRARGRSFAALRMTGPVLIVKNHYRGTAPCGRQIGINLRAYLILRGFAFSRRGLARRSRAIVLLCCVEDARSASSTQHTKTGERRRRSQAIVMGIRQTQEIWRRRPPPSRVVMGFFFG